MISVLFVIFVNDMSSQAGITKATFTSMGGAVLSLVLIRATAMWIVEGPVQPGRILPSSVFGRLWLVASIIWFGGYGVYLDMEGVGRNLTAYNYSVGFGPLLAGVFGKWVTTGFAAPRGVVAASSQRNSSIEAECPIAEPRRT